jgi:hypothetical protein
VAAAIAKNPALAARELHAFMLGVAAVMSVGAQYKIARMRVVQDPDGVAPEIVGHPGSDGHSGIEGLDRRSEELTKPAWKDALTALADRCTKIDDQV